MIAAPDAEDLADKLTALQTAHPWLDASSAATLAQTGQPIPQLLDTAEQLRSHAAQTYTGYTSYSYDPAQHQPSSQRAFAQGYVNTVAGGNPLNAQSLSSIQQNLQAGGYGTKLLASGMWDADWQAALQQHARDHYQAQLAGDKPMSVSSHGLLHSVLDAISPAGIASAVVGTVKSLPADFRQLVTDGIAGNLDPTASMFTGGNNAQVGAGVNQVLGGHETPEQFKARTQGGNGVASLVNDFGTLAMIVPGTGEAVGSGFKGLKALTTGSRLAEAQAGQGLITSSLGRTLGHEAAVRTPGLTAKALASQAGTKIATGAVLGGAVGAGQAALRGTDVTTGALQGVALGASAGLAARLGERFASKLGDHPIDAFDNLPVLRSTGPLIGKLTDADGLYYQMRNRLAKPYEYGAVRLAADAYSTGQAASLKLHGLAWLENTVGDDPNSQPIARYIAGSHPLDPLDQALATASQALHLPFTPQTDWLMYVLHGDLGVGKEPSESTGLTGKVAAAGQALHEGVSNALGQAGYTEKILRGTGQSYAQLLAKADGDPHLLDDWMQDKVWHAAAALHAENTLRLAPAAVKAQVTADWQRTQDFMRAAQDQAKRDPATLRAAHDLLAQAEHSNFLETFLTKERQATTGSYDAALRHGIGNYVRAGRTVRDHLLPVAEDELLTPQGFEKTPPGLTKAALSSKHLQLLRDNGFLEHLQTPGTGPVAEGSLGLLRQGKLHSSQALLDLQRVAKEAQPHLQALKDLQGADPDLRGALSETDRLAKVGQAQTALTDINQAMKAYAFNSYGIERGALDVFSGKDPTETFGKLFDLLADARKNLPTRVYPADTASAQTLAALAKVEKEGYWLVHGTDIGHQFLPQAAKNVDLGLLKTRQRQIAQALGLNTERFAPTDLAATIRTAAVSRMNRLVEDGHADPGQYRTVKGILNDLVNPDLVGEQQLPWGQNLAFAFGRRFHQKTLTALAEHYGGSLNDAEARLKGQLALSGGVRGLTRKTAVQVLTRLDADGVPYTDAQSAHRFFDAIQAAQSDSKIHQVGLTHLEDLMRHGAFRLLANHPDTLDSYRALAGLPNTLLRARDNLRFALNPIFSARKMVKTNIKMVADGVQPSPNPVRWMTEQGAWDDAHSLLDNIVGSLKGHYEFSDDGERYLDQTDLFGIYSPRQYEAMYAWQKKQQGFSDDDIRKGIVRVFGYGSNGLAGRTALERSTNLVFFPFSFEKTVLRNIGGYLMDHQAQALVLNGALDAYRKVSAEHPDAPLTSTWLDAHAPILNEALRLNAFAHGISPGELGGINAPLLNAFLPQSWDTSKSRTKLLERFVPMIADLNRITAEANSQAQVVVQSSLNGMQHLEGHGGTALNRLPSNETAARQKVDAIGFRNSLVDAFRTVIDFNNGQSEDTAKYHFGYTDNIPADAQGRVIDKSTLNLIVHSAYPAFDPVKGIEFAIANRSKAVSWINAQHGRADFATYQDFFAKAETAISHLNGDEYPAAQAAGVQQVFRAQAARLAASNPAFKPFYAKTFASAFGPLEQP